LFFFFFQAEDGIRDGHVTGVQTCALPILNRADHPALPLVGAGETPLQEKPFTLVIQIDAWNIRERDYWKQTEAKRKRGEDFSRWHWVYTATCFRLDHRCVQGKHRAEIGRAH